MPSLLLHVVLFLLALQSCLLVQISAIRCLHTDVHSYDKVVVINNTCVVDDQNGRCYLDYSSPTVPPVFGCCPDNRILSVCRSHKIMSCNSKDFCNYYELVKDLQSVSPQDVSRIVVPTPFPSPLSTSTQKRPSRTRSSVPAITSYNIKPTTISSSSSIPASHMTPINLGQGYNNDGTDNSKKVVLFSFLLSALLLATSVVLLLSVVTISIICGIKRQKAKTKPVKPVIL